jgi:hypothetical protein
MRNKPLPGIAKKMKDSPLTKRIKGDAIYDNTIYMDPFSSAATTVATGGSDPFYGSSGDAATADTSGMTVPGITKSMLGGRTQGRHSY